MHKSLNRIDFPFLGAKRIPANVLTSEGKLSVDGCNKLAIALFHHNVNKGQSPNAFHFKSETKRLMERI